MTDSIFSMIWSTLLLQDLGWYHVPSIFFINILYHHSTLSAILQVIVTIVSSNWQASNNNNVYQYQYWVLLVPAPGIADCWQNSIQHPYRPSINRYNCGFDFWFLHFMKKGYSFESNRIESNQIEINEYIRYRRRQVLLQTDNKS